MKKCATIIFSSVLFLLFSCENNSKQNGGTTQEPLCCDTITIHTKQRMIATDKESPTIAFDITLPLPRANNKAAAASIESMLAIELFENHGEQPKRIAENESALIDACHAFIDKQTKEFTSSRDIYYNAKEGDFPIEILNNYYFIEAKASQGYKGYLNYCVYWEDFIGGAHPNSYNYITVFNPNNGKEILLDAILKPGYEEPLLALLTKKLMEFAQVSTMEQLREKGFLYGNNDMYISSNFIAGTQELSFVYNKYELAPYAVGDLMLTVSFDEIKELLK